MSARTNRNDLNLSTRIKVDLRRYQDIIAVNTADGVVAYHARNLEVAELSTEAFESMTAINLQSNLIPVLDLTDSDGAAYLTQWNNEENLPAKSGHIEFGIKSLTLNITQICNLKCSYCAAGGDGTYGDPVNRINVEKTLPQLKFFLSQLPNGSLFNLSFVGGEPFLYPEAMKLIYDYIQPECRDRQIACKFMVTTNGTLITDQVATMLATMKIHVTVSLDGESNANDAARPSKDGKSSTQQTLKGLEKLTAIRSSLESIGISAVFSASHLDVVKSYLFFKTLGVDWYEFNFSYLEKDSVAQSRFMQEMITVAELAWQSGGEYELRKIKTFDSYFSTLDSQQRIQNFCGAGKSYLMIDAKNQIYTCPWLVGEKSEVVGIGSTLDYQKLDKYQKPLIELNNCGTCWARFICGGGCMYINRAHTGDKHKKDNLFCERTRGLILLAIVYYKKARA